MTNDTILVVGGAGYIGTHMVKDLLQEGFQVVVLDDLSTGHHDLLVMNPGFPTQTHSFFIIGTNICFFFGF